MDDQALYKFTSHIGGKNAQVRVYVDRLEWVLDRSLLAKATKVGAGVMTVGASLALTGTGRGSKGTEMIPVKSISSVTTARDGMLNSKVVVITSGNTIDFRISHSEAAEVKKVLTQLILGTHPAQQVPVVAPAPVAAPAPAPVGQNSIGDRLTQIETLRAQGILTDTEYAAKRASILAEI